MKPKPPREAGKETRKRRGGQAQPVPGVRRPTLADVAAAAGVVPMTASRALNGSGYVSAELRKRVRDAAHALNYRPNVVAQQLRGSRSRAIGILLPDIANPFFAGLAQGMMPVFLESKYTGFIAIAGRGSEDEAAVLQSFLDHRMDGMVVATRGTQMGAGAIRSICAYGVPVVVIGQPVAMPAVDCVTADHFQGAFDATGHLISLGHRTIAFLGSSAEDKPRLHRYEGYLAALEAAGIEANPAYAVGSPSGSFRSTQEDGYAGMLRLQKLRRPPTAVLARNDDTAIGAMRAVHMLRLRIPEDIAVAGFDNIPLSAYLTPPLTTVEQPIAEQGRIAAEILLAGIGSSLSRLRQSIKLPCKLVVRESTRGSRPEPN